MNQQKETFFSVDSRLLFQLGEKLVTDRAVALAELVKNGYDADAPLVTVKMEDVKTKGGTITIDDNGSGMTPAKFQEAWMRIATIDKEENPISSKYGRQKAGEKGIGRFACRRLAELLEVESVAEDDNQNKTRLNATFNWASFAPGTDVDKIPITLSYMTVGQETPTGTKLVLKQATESWSISDIKRLRQQLVDLISPISLESELETPPENYDPGFKIKIDCPEFPFELEDLDETFFKNSWAKLTASVDHDGFAAYQLDVNQGSKYLMDPDKRFKREKPFTYLRETKIEAYVFSYRTDFFRGSEWGVARSRKTGEERGGVKIYADNFRVFGYGTKGDDWLETNYDLARRSPSVDSEVSTYSNEGTRPGLALFRNQNVFGEVVFSREANKELEITVNRERITNGEAFEELKHFVRLGIDFATVVYANQVFKETQAKEEAKRAREEAAAKAREEIRKKAEETKQRVEEESKKAEAQQRRIEAKIQAAQTTADEAIEKRRAIENARREAEQYRRDIENMVHEREDPAWRDSLNSSLMKEQLLIEREKATIEEEHTTWNYLKEIRAQAERDLGAVLTERYKAEDETRRAEEALNKAEREELRRKRENLEKEFLLLRVLASTGTLILIFDHEIQALVEDMEEMVETTTQLLDEMPSSKREGFQYVLDSFSERIEMVKDLGEFLGLVMGVDSRAEKRSWVLYPIIEQVFRPFDRYLKASGIGHENNVPDILMSPRMYRAELVSVLHNLMSNAIKAVRGQQTRRIEIRGERNNDRVIIKFLDTGKGLKEERWEVVFEPFESDSEPDIKFGAGTGLGLKIVRDIIRAYDGDVRFCRPPEGWVTCLEIDLPVED